MFSPENRAKAEELVGRYPVARSALLPLLHLVQAQDGYVTPDGITECAELLGLTKAEVGAVATFYTMYKREPMGEHLVSVCTNFSCKVRGAQEVYDRLSATLGVGHNGTTADGRLTLEHAECLGNCEGAPVVSVDYLNYEWVDADAAAALVDRIRAGEVPPPTRGMVPPGVRAVSHRLAGLGPAPEEHDAAGAGRPTDQARADDAGVPAPEAGPGVPPTAVVPEFSPEREAERQAAKSAVREAGKDPDAVEDAAGPGAREFPTTDADWEPRDPTRETETVQEEEESSAPRPGAGAAEDAADPGTGHESGETDTEESRDHDE